MPDEWTFPDERGCGGRREVENEGETDSVRDGRVQDVILYVKSVRTIEKKLKIAEKRNTVKEPRSEIARIGFSGARAERGLSPLRRSLTLDITFWYVTPLAPNASFAPELDQSSVQQYFNSS